MEKQLKQLIKEFNKKADDLWEKIPKSDEKGYDVGYMSALEYAAYRIREVMDSAP